MIEKENVFSLFVSFNIFPNKERNVVINFYEKKICCLF